MPTPPKRPIPLWQWPNVLALDAALIATLWQAALASNIGASLSMAAHLVLGCSVWLSYTADRLFDVAWRDSSALLSVRHRFAKHQRIALWRVWVAVFIANLITATQLSSVQLKQGSVLLVLCLLYTFLNQKFSRHFFPKELCVALIYTSGVAVLLPASPPLTFLGLFAYLCWLNCLVIAKKESTVDAHLRIRSMAGAIRDEHLTPLIALGALIAFFVGSPLTGALATSFVLLGLINAWRKRLPTEIFRVLADSVLLLAPALVSVHFTMSLFSPC